MKKLMIAAAVAATAGIAGAIESWSMTRLTGSATPSRRLTDVSGLSLTLTLAMTSPSHRFSSLMAAAQQRSSRSRMVTRFMVLSSTGVRMRLILEICQMGHLLRLVGICGETMVNFTL